ncbi:hypothetical protein RCC89_05050 [Cytophagaceae bacterium ABcell3]|nr:hypothetical protein RCC89_05050 [Cytophagaceae bacterium ABcell3]
MVKGFILCLYIVFFLLGCSSVNDEPKIKSNWVSLEYLNCIKAKSPCDCLSLISNSYLIFDSLKSVNVFGQYVEPQFYEIKTINLDPYVVVGGDTVFFKFTDWYDTLWFNNNTFISNDSWEVLNDSFFEKINGDYFVEKYSDHIRGLYNLDSIRVICNSYSGIHFLKTGKSCKQQDLINYTADSIFVYNFINNCDYKSVNRKLEKELIAAFPRR